MANTLTGLIPSMYNALDVVSRELTGMIPAVTLDATHTRAAVGQQVVSPVTPAAAATDITPNVTPPNDGDQTIGNTVMTITKALGCTERSVRNYRDRALKTLTALFNQEDEQ